MKKITKAIFPVAGLGTRFLPATKANPKEMLPIVDKPLIQYAVEEAINAGIKEFTTKCGHAKFCSPTCKRHQNAKLSKQAREEGKYRYHLSKKIKTKFGNLPCFHCGWGEAICDVHHIKGRKDGGTDDYSNLTILCPNDHRLVHKGKIQSKNLKTLENYSQ